jgi:hypothetical protein
MGLLILPLNWVSTFRHSYGQVSRYFISRSPKLRYRDFLRYLVPLYDQGHDQELMHKDDFREFAFREFGDEASRLSKSRSMKPRDGAEINGPRSR